MKLRICDILVVVTLCVTFVTSNKIVHHVEGDHWEYPRYAFDYAVHDPFTGDHKHQWEERDGEMLIGEYGLVEPDGSLRIVKYTSHPHHGFNAEVKKMGPTIHHKVHHEPHHHEPHHIALVEVPHLIPVIRKPVRHTSIFKKIKDKKDELYEHALHKLEEHKHKKDEFYDHAIHKLAEHKHKKNEYYEHALHKLDEHKHKKDEHYEYVIHKEEHKPFKPLKYLFENVVKKHEKHEEPAIETLLVPHHGYYKVVH